MTARNADRALTAVRRVREARERDSRVGLQQAFATVRQREAEAEASRARLAAAPAFGAGSALEYQAHTRRIAGLAEAVVQRDEAVRRSNVVAEEARRRWTADRQALRTVELLLERRAQERHVERFRRETADLDDLAAQGWLRRVVTASGSEEATP